MTKREELQNDITENNTYIYNTENLSPNKEEYLANFVKKNNLPNNDIHDLYRVLLYAKEYYGFNINENYFMQLIYPQ